VGEVHLPACRDTFCCVGTSNATGCRLTCCKIGVRGLEMRPKLYSGRQTAAVGVRGRKFVHRQERYNSLQHVSRLQSFLIASLSARTFFIEQTEGQRPGLESIASEAVSPMYEPAIGYVRYLAIDHSDNHCRRSPKECIYPWG
jgi:hypothetical protein